MKVCMKIKISGTRDGQPWPEIGEEITVPDAEGAELCTQGYAQPVGKVEQPETRDGAADAKAAADAEAAAKAEAEAKAKADAEAAAAAADAKAAADAEAAAKAKPAPPRKPRA